MQTPESKEHLMLALLVPICPHVRKKEAGAGFEKILYFSESGGPFVRYRSAEGDWHYPAITIATNWKFCPICRQPLSGPDAGETN